MLNLSKKRSVGIILLLSVYSAVHIIYTKIISHSFDMPMQFSVSLQLVSYIVLGSAGFALFRTDIKEGIALWKKHPKKNIGFLVGAYVLDILLSNLALIPINCINPDYQSINEHSVAELQGKFPVLLLVIALGIMGPVTEEILFRLIPTCLTEKKSIKVIGLFVSAFLFMLIHIQGFTVEEFLYNLPHLVSGVIYGTVTLMSRNVTIPILLHIMNNLPAVLFLMFS